MDDIIVIILTLALTIVAAINQSKKKKQQLPQPESGEPDFWEEILHGGKPKPAGTGEYHDHTEPVVTPAKVRKPADNPLKMRKTARNAIIQEPIKEGGRNEDILRYGEIREASIADREMAEKGETILEDFSLKKAVIYSEILKPKYF
ncbi:MAG: hypothetical protein ACOZDD_00970 [Bacteroidota bacterium]